MLEKIFWFALFYLLACVIFLTGCNAGGVDSGKTPSSSDEFLPVTSIELSINEDLELLVGDTRDIIATAYIDSEICSSAIIEWESSDSSVAIVSKGKIVALGGGCATISANCGEITKSLNVFVAKRITAKNVNSFSEEYVNVYGRSYITNEKLNFDHSANAVELAIIGTSLSVDIESTTNSYMRVFIDNDAEGKRISVSAGTKTYKVAENLTNGYHKIRIVKVTESLHASWDLSNFNATAFATLPEKSDLKIEFIGDSITAGNANLGSQGDAWSVDNSDSSKTYAYLTAQKLNANYSIVALSGICVKAYHWVKNLNMSTMYANVSNVNTEKYSFDFNPDVIVLNIGTNDANYASNVDSSYAGKFTNDYLQFLSFIRAKNPNAHIVCIYGMTGSNPAISAGIYDAIDNMNDNNIVYNPFAFQPNTSGGADHPSLSAHQAWSEALANYIIEYRLTK